MFQQDRNRCHSNVGSVIAAEARRHEFSSVAIFLSMLLIAVMLQGVVSYHCPYNTSSKSGQSYMKCSTGCCSTTLSPCCPEVVFVSRTRKYRSLYVASIIWMLLLFLSVVAYMFWRKRRSNSLQQAQTVAVLQPTQAIITGSQAYAYHSYNPSGYNPSGYNPSGYNPSGYTPSSYNPSGYNPSGYNPSGYNPSSYNPSCCNQCRPYSQPSSGQPSFSPAPGYTANPPK